MNQLSIKEKTIEGARQDVGALMNYKNDVEQLLE